MSLIGKSREGAGQKWYKTTRGGRLRRSRTPYTCGTAIRRGKRMGLCRRTVDGPRDRCYQHKGGAFSGSAGRAIRR